MLALYSPANYKVKSILFISSNWYFISKQWYFTWDMKQKSLFKKTTSLKKDGNRD